MRELSIIFQNWLSRYVHSHPREGDLAGISKGVFLVAVEPRATAVKEHLSAAGAKLLPAEANPRALTAAEAGLSPAGFAIGTSDTAFSALRKVFQALGHAGLDPEL